MSDYYIIITDAGAALEAAAHASGTPVTLTEFAAGDGGGAAVTPDPTRTALVNEVYRGNISSLTINADDNTVLNAQCIIPADSGGYTVREIGIYADDGTLYAIGNYIEQVKPDPGTGTAITMDVSVQLAVSDTADINLYINPGDYLTKEEADELYLKLTGGAMTGPIGFPVDNALSSYALNRQAPASVWDVYKALPVMNSSWNRIGAIDSTIQFGRAILTIYGSNSHDVGMAVQTGFVMIDIIGTDKQAPGCTLTYYRPDEAKGSSITSAIVAANQNDGTKYDLWIQTQSAVAGLMMVGQQSFPDFFTPYDPIGHQVEEPTPATPTGIINLVTANSVGKVNVKGELTVSGGTSLEQGVTVTNGAIIYDELSSAMNRTETYPDGTFVNGGLVRSFIFGRGAYGDSRGAFTNLYIQELVGSYNQAVLNLNGYEDDKSWIFRNDGSFFSPGKIFEAGQRVYSPNNPQPINLPQIVQDVQLGGRVLIEHIGDIFQTPAGCVMVSLAGDSDNDTSGYYAPIQKNINGSWITIAG